MYSFAGPWQAGSSAAGFLQYVLRESFLMPFLIGVDEAGYGPNLGPLLISASAWRVPEVAIDLYDTLSDAVSRSAQGTGEHIAIADSKLLYKSRGSLAGLERAVFAALAQRNQRPRDWRQLWTELAGASAAHQQNLPWYCDYNEPLPLDADATQMDTIADRLRSVLSENDVDLAAFKSVAVFPRQFNHKTSALGTKSATLTTTTLELLAEMLAELPDDDLMIVCDKHGGRNRYLPALQQQFPEYLIEVRRESGPLSVYCWGPPERRTEIRFQVKGERFLPAALASLASKYLRELAMRPFNAYWCARVPQLRPTAGYPTDAKRFRLDIESARQDLGIEWDDMWRIK